MVFGTASQLGVDLFEDNSAVVLIPESSEEEIETIIRAVYRQVLGNAYVMESERLTVPESQLRNAEITVREFVRRVAKSELYWSRFFDNCPRYRSIELNFKHLLGRAPESYEEMEIHSQILDQGGYPAEIDAYINSDEYLQVFGEDTVPFYQGYKTQTGHNVVGFTHLFQLLRGECSSDRSSFVGTRSRLQRSLLTNTPSVIIPLSSPPSYEKTVRYQPQNAANQLIARTLGLNNLYAVANPGDGDNRSKQPDLATPLQRQYQSFQDNATLELLPGRSEEDVETVIRAVYRQVLGNAHVMESERLIIPESQLKRGEISVREFVRQVAKSELYRSRFFDNCPRYRSIELNFKHLLGCAPDDYAKTFYQSQILDEGGFEAEIDSYIDSDEYQDNFGENIVPFCRGYQTQTGKKLLGFTNMFKLQSSLSTSDKAGKLGNRPRLSRALIYNSPKAQAPITDIQQLLDQVFKPKPKTAAMALDVVNTEAYLALQGKCEAQREQIAALEQQLSDIKPLASIGTHLLSQGQYYSGSLDSLSALTAVPSAPPIAEIVQKADNYPMLLQQFQQQEAAIAALSAQLADLQRYATIGEFRLNKWRQRSFSN